MRTLCLALVLSVIPTVAFADRVPAPPDDCPRGSEGRTSHSGRWCAPTTCEADADCRTEGTRCEELALCVEQESYVPGGRTRDRTPRSRPVARGACLEDACPGAAECQTARRCVPADEPEAEAAPEETPTEAAPEEAPAEETAADDTASEEPAADPAEGGGGCAVSPRGAPVGAFGLLALFVFRARRRSKA